MEKTPAAVAISVSSSDESNDVQPLNKWTPGYWNRFPYIGAIALACIAILACAALGVLIGSDGVSTSTWPQRIAPNVVLSAVNAVSSLALTIAVGEGVAIAWWRHAMKGSTVQELHHQWQLSGGAFALITRPKSLFTSSIALAVLATQITLLNSILYQRATSTYTAPDTPRTLATVGIAAQEFPTTGYVVSDTSVAAQTACECFMIGDSFTPVVNNWQTSNGFFGGYNELFRFAKQDGSNKAETLEYCNGICLGSLEAIGFEIDCTQTQEHQNIATVAIAAYDSKDDPSAWTNLPIFNSSFALEYSSDSRNYSQIAIDLQFFQSDDPFNPTSTSCPGTVYKKQCNLRPAIISYPLKVTNFTNEHIINGVELVSTNVLAPSESLNNEIPPPKYDSDLKQAEGFKVVRYLYTNDTHEIRSLTQLGGLANAISQVLKSTAAITYTGVDNSWSLDLMGTLAGRMMFGPPNMGSCDCSFRSDSLDIIIASINQLTFLTATGMVDTSSFRGLPNAKTPFPSNAQASIVAVDSNYTATFADTGASASQLTDVVHYQTHYLFAGLAFGITIICIVLVIPAFWHYGELGRRVTLGPVEIASAFGAPILVDDRRPADHAEDQTDNIDSLIKHIGERKIVYGFVDVDEENRRQEMQLEGHGAVSTPAPYLQPDVAPKSPLISESPMPSPMLNAHGEPVTSILHKRRSVRLAMGAPERVRPTTQLFPTPKSPRLGHVGE